MEPTPDIQSDALSAPEVVPDSASAVAPGEQRTHYKSLEEADAAARRFQSEFDKAKAEAEKWAPLKQWESLGGPAAIGDLVRQVVDIAARPDFNDYRDGRLGKESEAAEDDPYLTDEQREIVDLRKKLEERESRDRSQQGQVNGELAAIRFERAEKGIQTKLGNLWDTRRDQVLAEVQRIVGNGAVRSLDAIGEPLLFKAWAASFNGFDEFNAAVTKFVLDNEAKRAAAMNGRSTLPPTSMAPGRSPSAPPKSLKEAWEIGLREAQALHGH